MERAEADGVSLVDPGRLLADLTKRVLESMFGEGAKLIALAGFGFVEGEHAQRTVMSGSFGSGGRSEAGCIE